MEINNYFEKLRRSRFIKNTGWIIFAQVYQMFLSLVIGVISARYLGPGNYGTINYAASYISFFTIACTLGLEGVVVKEMIDNRDDEGTLLGSSIAMRLAAGVLSQIVVCIIVHFINPGDKTLLIVSFLQSLVLLFNAFHIIDTWYQSYLRSKVSTIIKCIAYTCMSLYRVVLLINGKGVEWFAFATSLDAGIIAALYLFRYRKDGVHKLQISLTTGRYLIGLSYHLIISSMMAVIYNQMDRLMIGKMIDQTHVGYYAAASTLCHMWLFIPQALANSARPIIMELKGKDEKLYIRRIKQLNGVTFWIGVLFALIVSSLSFFIIDILYGAEYAPAKTPLMLIIWSTVFSSLSYSRAIWLISENKQKYTKQILLCGVIINLILNSIGIKAIGMNGAAIATIVTEFVCCFIAPLLFKETRMYVKYILDSINISWIIQTSKIS